MFRRWPLALLCTTFSVTSVTGTAGDLHNLPGTPNFLPTTAQSPATATPQLPLTTNLADPQALTLQGAIVIALRRNPTLNMSVNTRKVQRYDLLMAQEKFFPQTNLSASGTYSQDSDNSGDNSTTRQASIGPNVNWLLPLGTTINGSVAYNPSIQSNPGEPSTLDQGNSWNITITQPLLQGFGLAVNEASLHNAEDQQTIDSLQLQQQVMTTVTNTITDYYALVQAQNAYAIAKQTLAAKQKTVFIRQQNLKAGRIAGMDLVQAELDLTSQQQAVDQAQLTLDNARSKLLTQDLGLPGNTPFHVVETLHITQIHPLPLADSISAAMAHNLDMQIANLQYQQQQRNLMVDANQRLWNLDLTASQTQDRENTQFAKAGIINDSNTLTKDSSVGLTLTIPLNHTGIDQQELTDATAADNAQITLANTRQTLAANVTNALASLHNLWVQMQISDENLKLTESSTEAATIKFRYGKLDAFTLSQQQQQLVQAKLNVINSQIAYLTEVLAYQQLMGTLLSNWHIHFQAPEHSNGLL